MEPTDPSAPPASDARPHFTCAACGASLRGRTIEELCPECGTPVLHSVGNATSRPTSGFAVASLVLGIVAVVGCIGYGFFSIICGPLAIVFGLKADKALKRGDAGGSTKGMATAGLVMGIIGTLLGLIAIGFLVIGIVASLSGGGRGGSGFFP